MAKNQSFKKIIIDSMWTQFNIGLSGAEVVIETMEKENPFLDGIMSESDALRFVEGPLKHYLRPNNLDRMKIYDQKFLDENGIILDFVKAIPDGWGCNLYFDKKNNIYWEDNYGRYAKEGFKISPYINPLKIY